MMSRMVGSALTLLSLLFSVEDAAAQTYTQMQWGMNKATTPYQFGANINGAWSNLGTVSSSGVWQIPATNFSGLAPSATIDTTNASNITSGTLSVSRLPVIPASNISGLAPSATTDTTNASNITSGTLAAGRLPAFSGECSSSAGSSALSCPKIWRGSVAAEAYGADPTGSANSDTALDAAVAAAGGGCVTFGAGQFKFSASHAYSAPVCILGVGKGAGPGAAAHDYTHVTEFVINSATNILFNVTSNVGSRFEDFRCNTAGGSRPATTNGCIKLSGDSGTVAAPIIHNIATTQVARPIQLVAPAWPSITENYFDDWAGNVETDAAIYCSTVAAREGSCGFISHNFFFGGTSSGPVLYSEVGYTDFHDNEALAVGIAIRFKYRNFSAGYTKIHDNTIENFGKFGNVGLIIESGDGSTSGFIMIQNNEFFAEPSNSPLGAIFVSDYLSTPAWLEQLIISGNILRSAETMAGGYFIRVGAGKNVQVTNNEIRADGGNSPYGIIISGVSTNAGLIAPILVKDNTLTGTFTNKYVLTNAVNIVWSDMTGSTVGAGGSQLPAFAGVGSEAVVTDGAAALAWGDPIAGGGADTYKVFSNGANWTVQAK